MAKKNLGSPTIAKRRPKDALHWQKMHLMTVEEDRESSLMLAEVLKRGLVVTESLMRSFIDK